MLIYCHCDAEKVTRNTNGHSFSGNKLESIKPNDAFQKLAIWIELELNWVGIELFVWNKKFFFRFIWWIKNASICYFITDRLSKHIIKTPIKCHEKCINICVLGWKKIVVTSEMTLSVLMCKTHYEKLKAKLLGIRMLSLYRKTKTEKSNLIKDSLLRHRRFRI